jgi:hypothetical protein
MCTKLSVDPLKFWQGTFRVTVLQLFTPWEVGDTVAPWNVVMVDVPVAGITTLANVTPPKRTCMLDVLPVFDPMLGFWLYVSCSTLATPALPHAYVRFVTCRDERSVEMMVLFVYQNCLPLTAA